MRPDNAAGVELLRVDTEQQTLQPLEWPARLAELKEVLERELQISSRREEVVAAGFSDVGGPSDSPFKEAGAAGVPPVGRTVGPTLINGTERTIAETVSLDVAFDSDGRRPGVFKLGGARAVRRQEWRVADLWRRSRAHALFRT